MAHSLAVAQRVGVVSKGVHINGRKSSQHSSEALPSLSGRRVGQVQRQCSGFLGAAVADIRSVQPVQNGRAQAAVVASIFRDTKTNARRTSRSVRQDVGVPWRSNSTQLPKDDEPGISGRIDGDEKPFWESPFAVSFKRNARVKGTVQEVFDYVSDLSHTEEWDPALPKSWKDTASPIVDIGTTFSLEACFKIGPIKKYAVTQYTVIDYEPAREWQYIDWPRDVPVARVSYLAQSIAHRSIDTFTFFGDGPGRTRVTYSFTLLLKGPLTQFATPIFKPAMWLLGVEAVKGLERRLNKSPVLHTGVMAGFRDEVGNWLVQGVSMGGWGLISSIPIVDGESLLNLFLKTAGPNLLSWPARPPPNDPSWIWLGTWHAGLFLFMGLSKYGIKQRKLGSVD
eukprot:TRINITY_DN6829_c0_g2_i1.p1 TRINITY_DN6829_c0_g2~~TRINITY_DN6829_c0_g2_i1.p1  ORF type:complete len:396 (-),score=44.86 TRINITY_DN6829_c0_g2_i1:337-1524(-)